MNVIEECTRRLILIHYWYIGVKGPQRKRRIDRLFHNMFYLKLHFPNFNKMSSEIAYGCMPP